jgi:hypothetical protein
MEWVWWVLVVVAALAIGTIVSWRPLRRFGHHVQVARAQELFRLQRERLEGLFSEAAAASGTPRGLLWKDCAFEDRQVLARDRTTGQLIALAAVTVRFEAVPGGPMEEVEAVGNLRTASAVFYFDRGQWHTVGKALFNMGPEQALEHFHQQYERAPIG